MNRQSIQLKSICLVVFLTLTAWSTQCSNGIGMTMPVNRPSETCHLNIFSSPTMPFTVPTTTSALLPVDAYELAPNGFLDNTTGSFVSGSCSISWQACPGTGTINEQDGRLNPFLRFYAATQDAKFILVSAVWTALGQTVPGSPSFSTCGGTAVQCAGALAQLAVTGRQAYNSFASWDPLYAPVTSGPQLSDLIQLVQAGYAGSNASSIPPLSSVLAVASNQLQNDASAILTLAYTTLNEIRSNDPAWRQFRAGTHSWIAVSGEDDTPQRPVDVFTAPFPQYDIAVPVNVSVNGQNQSFTLTTRYMVAAAQTSLPIKLAPKMCPSCTQLPAATPLPAIPMAFARIPNCTVNAATHQFCLMRRFELPAIGIPPALNDMDQYRYVIYIHGGGSRLEEAVTLAQQLLSQDGSGKLIVISFDLPNSAYADQLLRGSTAGPVSLDPSLFEDQPAGNAYNFPVLNFTMQFVTNFISTLGQQGVIDTQHVIAVMGGSLGGNISLLLSMNGQPSNPATLWPANGISGSPNPSPFNSANMALSNMLPSRAAIVAWSPTSMVSYFDNSGTLVSHNLTTGQNSVGWGAETPSTRSQYFFKLYFTSTTGFPANLPPDPEMWYRSDWSDSNNVNDCKASFIAQSRFDRYEIYSSLMRRWTTALDTEQAIFSFQTNTDTTNKTYAPNYSFIARRVLLAAGACDDFDNGANNPVLPTMSMGTCNGQQIGNTGGNQFQHQDIYGFTHDVANDMQMALGKTLFLNDTGHSIHDECPQFFAGQILQFLRSGDNNLNVSLFTGSDDVRENSEVHVVLGQMKTPPQTPPVFLWQLDIPLNYWFHPWPGGSVSPNNPCGVDCTWLSTFDLHNNTFHNFSIALPPGTNDATINSFQIEFISGWNIAPESTDAKDGWNLAGIAACSTGSTGSFVSSGSTSVPVGTPSTLNAFAATNFGLPGILWQPPSFSSISTLASPTNNCNRGNTNPPPNGDVKSSLF